MNDKDSQPTLLEVCVSDPESIVSARRGGAARVELCSALEAGGLTPSLGLIRRAVSEPEISVNVLIRPRPGDFLYSEEEKEIIIEDIRIALENGADGIVIGALTEDGDVDKEFMQRVKSVSNNASLTFHRAFDLCRDPHEALETLVDIGFDRILTSGLEATAERGIATLKRLNAEADGRIIILAGCGVNGENAARIISETGVRELHASAKDIIGSGMRFRRKNVSMGTADTDEYARFTTSVEAVKKIVENIKEL